MNDVTEYLYRGWKIEEFQNKYFVEVDDKNYVFYSIDDTYNFIDEVMEK